MLPGEPGSETSCMASGRDESIDSRLLDTLGSEFAPLYESNFVAVVVGVQEKACCRAGEVPLIIETASDSAHVANSAVSSRTHCEALWAAPAEAGFYQCCGQ